MEKDIETEFDTGTCRVVGLSRHVPMHHCCLYKQLQEIKDTTWL